MKAKLVVGLAVAVGCAVAGVVLFRPQAVRQAAWQTVKSERKSDSAQSSNQALSAPAPVEAPSTQEQLPPEQIVTRSVRASQTQTVKGEGQLDLSKGMAAAAPQAYQERLSTEAWIPEPLARLALSFVGADSDAEEVWVQAINDTNLTPDERRELIEDLNQEGFADPRNLTANDLSLIVNRIALIEQLAPDSMDEVNAAAFQEAYKDLVNMYARVTGS